MSGKHPLFEFYKELYFHEIEVRENLNSRVQIPLAIIVSLVGALAFMLLKLDEQISGAFIIAFIFFLTLSGATLIVSIIFLVSSWTGHTYSFLPTASDTENYREKLIETYSAYKNSDELVQGYLDQYICNFYINSSTTNTKCNDKRSMGFHKTNKYLVITIIFTAVTFLCFYIGDIDKTQINRPMEIGVVNPVEIMD